MAIEPSNDAFAARYDHGAPQVVWTTLVGDLETPVSAFLKVASGTAPSFLFESVEGGAVRGRYSIIGLKPDLTFRVRGQRAEINRTSLTTPEAFSPCLRPPLEALRELIAECRIDLPDELPPPAAGLFGYLGYDMVRLMERLPDINPDPLRTPDAVLIRPTIVIVFDAVKDAITIVTPVRPQAGVSSKSAYARAAERLNEIVDALDKPLGKSEGDRHDGALAAANVSNTTPSEYAQMVARAKEYIVAGDIFQVVLSQRFQAPYLLSPFSLYRALRRVNPSPFLYFLDLPGFAVVGSSPEILVRVRDGEVTIRPIAGTRPRGKTEQEDREAEVGLLADPKECAEHLMLLDLGRHDVGRVASAGSVEVTASFTIERYSHVMHIVSNVVGRLSPSKDALDALFAGFPAGTVSGAPKVRACEIIAELEPETRGPYAGGVGYFAPDGSVDSCIVLRTAVVKDGVMHVQAGAGIVADSDPAYEQRECEAKAAALLAAAREAARVASEAGFGQ